MSFDGTADQPATVRTSGTPPCGPPADARIIDEALDILGPNGEHWIQNSKTDRYRNIAWSVGRSGGRQASSERGGKVA
jgi:hypothetical protein